MPEGIMSYKQISINTAQPEKPRSRVMIIYTGGTFGMAYSAQGTLVPFDFSLILEHLPTLRNLFLELTVVSFDHPIDSSNVQPAHWQTIGQIIYNNYHQHDGFVVLHGTDTMAFTASALSFMLRGLAKPVVFTGAQLPITEPRSDARENLITALEIASSKTDGKATVPEVCIFFDYQLLRGNRAKKVESMHFDAFESENYPALATAGVKIDYNYSAIKYPNPGEMVELWYKFNPDVTVLKLFPGMSASVVEAILQTKGVKAVVMETFGSGNAPSDAWFIALLRQAIQKGIIVVNISQCPGGMVIQGKYETSRLLNDLGVVSGSDMSLEAAITKLMILLGEYEDPARVRALMSVPLAGEVTPQ